MCNKYVQGYLDTDFAIILLTFFLISSQLRRHSVPPFFWLNPIAVSHSCLPGHRFSLIKFRKYIRSSFSSSIVHFCLVELVERTRFFFLSLTNTSPVTYVEITSELNLKQQMLIVKGVPLRLWWKICTLPGM